jgi:hypothetical protein
MKTDAALSVLTFSMIHSVSAFGAAKFATSG